MKKWLLTGAMCLSLLLSGCKPEGIIPPGDMESLFAEFYMADACIESMNMASAKTTINPDSLRVYQPIIERRGFTEEMFRNSVDYYLHRPDELVSIFRRIRVRLEREADRPVGRVDTDEEVVDEITDEGSEPAIERELKPLPERKPAPKPAKTRKKVNKEDLKRLEEGLE